MFSKKVKREVKRSAEETRRYGKWNLSSSPKITSVILRCPENNMDCKPRS